MTPQQIAREALAEITMEMSRPECDIILYGALERIAALPPSPSVEEVCEVIAEKQAKYHANQLEAFDFSVKNEYAAMQDALKVAARAIRAKWGKP